MKQQQPQNQASRLEGYILIPHELLHVAGYRLVGNRCNYQWGHSSVTPSRPMTRWQDLVGTLFPFLTFGLMFLTSGVLAGLAYGQALRQGSFFGFIFWTGFAFIMGLYASTAIGDLRHAYLSLTNKPWYSWTPFDFLYWPMLDWEKVRKKVNTGEIDAEQD